MFKEYSEKDFQNDKKLASKIVEKADKTSFEFNDIEIATVQNVTCANSYKDVNLYALRMLYYMADKLKIKY